MKINLRCCLCKDNVYVEAKLPEGWILRHKEISEENCFCSKHSKVKEWSVSQCPGCVGYWYRDCPLWREFSYGRRGLNEKDFDKIREGVCPRRVNGILHVGSYGKENLVIVEKASKSCGEAFAQAILDYWEIFGTKD
jgi:hypothetical protein